MQRNAAPNLSMPIQSGDIRITTSSTTVAALLLGKNHVSADEQWRQIQLATLRGGTAR